ncbi:MFS transporter [Magnetovibrio sp. PR-2]|uniref:MFS transporter n=1 Tax=Magnetovibrio sp. PR-2 TaxID=3120356 RepID=UPI002FCDFA4D
MLKSVKTMVFKADRAVWSLAFGETLVWAGLFYIFPALLLHWETAQGWSRAELGAAMTAALVVSALCAPVMGRLIDRGWGRYVLTTCAVVGGSAVFMLGFTQSYEVFFAIWILIGLCMSGCLYEPCFAYLTHSRPRGAKQAITLVTLAAGFASTLCFPIANFLAAAFSWQTATHAFGLIVIFVAAPLLWLGTGAAHGFRRTVSHNKGQVARGPSHILRQPAFWLLAVTYTAIGLNHTMLVSHMLPILEDRGASATLAVVIASLIGPMQVFGRVAMMVFDHRVSVFFISGMTFVLLALASSSLYFAGFLLVGLLAFALFQGSGYGVTSITKPLVVAEIMGRSGFGTISGLLAVPYLMAYALAPSLAAHIWTVAGYDTVLLLCISLPIVGGVCFGFASRQNAVDAKAAAAFQDTSR